MSVRNGCVCEQEPCICPYRIEIQRPGLIVDALDALLGMRWEAVVRHPTVYSALNSSFHAYTARGAERKALRWIKGREKRLNSLRVVEVQREGRS